MRRKLKTLKCKGGHSDNGSPRQLIDETVYREHWNFINATIGSPHWDPQYSGWSNASRPRDHAIFLRAGIPTGGPPAPPINLGTGADFAIFGFAGITNVTTSEVNGDMGVDPVTSTAITGFGPGGGGSGSPVVDGSDSFATSSQVVGKIYAPDYTALGTPAKVILAHNDILAAYTSAQGLVPTHPENFNAGLLGGQILTPGVWNWTTAVSVSGGSLTLNGAGNYVLQMASTFDLDTNIVLAGGALPQNVFWAIAGEATLHAGSEFFGELLGGNGIAVQAGGFVNGRLLAQTSVTLIQNIVIEV